MIQTQTFPFTAASAGGERLLAVTLRAPTIDDQLSFRAAAADGLATAITHTLNTCTVEVQDPGPWKTTTGALCSVDWAAVPSGIRLQAMLTLKMHSKAKDSHLADVDLVCGRCRKEDSNFRVAVNLLPIERGGELLWFDPEDPASIVDAIVGKHPIPSTVGGVAVTFHPPSGMLELRLEAQARELRKQITEDEARGNELGLRGRALQLASVDGVHPNDHLRWVRGLPEDVYDELEAAIEANDWGIDLSFEAKCPRGHKVKGEIPFVALFGRPTSAVASLQERRRARARTRATENPPTSPD